MILSVVTLILATWRLDLAVVWDILRTANPGWVLAALASVGVNQVAKAFRWEGMFAPARERVRSSQLLAAVLVGQSLNYLLPLRVGEISRTISVGATGPGKTFTLGTIALEKILDLLAYALLCGVLLLTSPIPEWVEVSTVLLAMTAVVFTGLVLGLAHRQETALKFLQLALRPVPQRFRESLLMIATQGLASLESLRSRGAAARLAAWTIIIWATALLTNHLTLLALGLSLPLDASLLLLVALMAGVTLPAGPGRIGVFEYLSVLALRPFAIPREVAFGYGVLLHAIVMLPVLMGGLATVWLGDGSPRPPGAPT